MNKKIKGYEVMKLIAEKQIKVGQEFLFTYTDGVKEKIFWDGENFKYFEAENSFVLRTVGDIEFAVGDFEILEDEEEIDIQAINENDYKIVYWTKNIFTSETINDLFHKIVFEIMRNRNKQNEILKAVKQLDKKINKEE